MVLAHAELVSMLSKCCYAFVLVVTTWYQIWLGSLLQCKSVGSLRFVVMQCDNKSWWKIVCHGNMPISVGKYESSLLWACL